MRHVIKLILPDKDSTQVVVEATSIDEALAYIGGLIYDGQLNFFYRPSRFYADKKRRYRYPVNMKHVIYAQYVFTEED